MLKKKIEAEQLNQDIIIEEDTEVSCILQLTESEKINGKFKIIHAKPNLLSRIKLKAVVYDEAQLILQPDLVIERGATNTDSYLKIDVLLLSPSARATVVPNLEIMEESVKAGHGATVGQLDYEQMFYLMSRGLTKQESEEILVTTFLEK